MFKVGEIIKEKYNLDMNGSKLELFTILKIEYK